MFLASGFSSNDNRNLDKRNFYIAIAPEGSGINNEPSDAFDSSSISSVIDTNSPNMISSLFMMHI